MKQKQLVDNWANQKQDTNGHNDISVEVLLKRFDQLCVKIDLNKLRLVRLMTTKLFCSCSHEVIHIELTEEFCDTCREKIDDG